MVHTQKVEGSNPSFATLVLNGENMKIETDSKLYEFLVDVCSDTEGWENGDSRFMGGRYIFKTCCDLTITIKQKKKFTIKNIANNTVLWHSHVSWPEGTMEMIEEIWDNYWLEKDIQKQLNDENRAQKIVESIEERLQG